MLKLHAYPSAPGMYGVDKTLQPRDMKIVGDPHSTKVAVAFRRNIGGFQHIHGTSALGAFFMITNKLVGDLTITRCVIGDHRSHDDTVFQRHAVDCDFGKKHVRLLAFRGGLRPAT